MVEIKKTMTHTQDKYFCWIKSSLGDMRIQHHKGIIESVDDGRIAWAKGKTIETVLEWVKQRDEDKTETIHTKNQERILYYEEEKKARAIWERDHWICMEGGNGYLGNAQRTQVGASEEIINIDNSYTSIIEEKDFEIALLKKELELCHNELNEVEKLRKD